MKRDKETSFGKYRKVLKERARDLKDYLKGRVIKGTEATSIKPKGRKKAHRTMIDQKSPSFLKKKRDHRKMRNKMAYKSRRVNQLRGG